MQIKQFYLDLREWPQYARNNWNVWLLESEAFKEPLKFEFTFDLDDIAKRAAFAAYEIIEGKGWCTICISPFFVINNFDCIILITSDVLHTILWLFYVVSRKKKNH